jgi:hypothetical protein
MIKQNTIITIAAIRDKNIILLFPLGHADCGTPLLHACTVPAFQFMAACYFCSMISMSYEANANDCCYHAASIVPIA